jgi:hypothetical protein
MLTTSHALKRVFSIQTPDQINDAIDEWAESLVALIAASDNPEASLLRAHVAIASKHKELESMAWQELQTRKDSGRPNG